MTPRTPPQDPLATANVQLRRQARIMARAGMTPEAYPVTERRPTQGKENISAGLEWVYAPNTFDWTIVRANFSLAAGATGSCTIGTADSYGSLPSWGSQFDSVFLYTARAGLFQHWSQLTVHGGGNCDVMFYNGWAEHEMTLRQGVTYDHMTTLPLQADQGVGGQWDFISTPTVTNRDAGSRTFTLRMFVEAILLA